MRQTIHPTRPLPASRICLAFLGGVLALLSPIFAEALEIGGPTANPVLGHPLHIEMPLTLAAGEKAPRGDCLRLTPRPDDSDGDFFPKDARATVELRSGGAHLVVVSPKGVANPAVGFRLAIGCDAGVSRDVMLLASPPEILKPARQGANLTAEPAPVREIKKIEMVVSRNTTLNKLARARYPSSRETRDEYRRLLAEANPELFANVEHVGTVALPAGTILKLPTKLPKREAAVDKPAEIRPGTELPQADATGIAAQAAASHGAQNSVANDKPRPTTRRKEDRLVIGAGQGRVPSLSQQELRLSLDRLEQMMTEKSRGDLAMSETLTSLAASFGEVKAYMQGVEERVKHAEAEQLRAQTELQLLREELRGSFSPIELLLAVIGGGALGAALIVLYQRLTMRPQASPFGAAQPFDSTAPSPAPLAHDTPVTSSVVPQPQDAATRVDDAASRTSPSYSSRLEPTAKTSIARAADLGAPSHPKPIPPIPDRFASIRKTSAGQTTNQEQAAEDAESRNELKLPEANPAANAEMPSPRQPASSHSLPDAESTLELSLGEDQGQNAELTIPGSGIDPVLELADVMTSLGLAKEAATAVVEHVRQNPHPDPLHWFKVLEIYRTTGHREGFEEAVQELRLKLNVSIDEWDAEAPNGDKTSLEDYPHLCRELQALWQKPECETFLTNLLEDNRGGKRVGFPQPVAEEIVLLKAILRNAPLIEFPPIERPNADSPELAESKAWREVRLIP